MTWITLFADDGSGWASLVGSVLNIGFAAAVGWYLLTKALPKMQDTQSASAKELQAAYVKAIEDNQQKFDKHGELRRVEYKEALAAVILHAEREGERRDKEMSRRDDTLRIELNAVAKVVETNTGAVEDLREFLFKHRSEIKGE